MGDNDEIEITPEMIEAGLAVLLSRHPELVGDVVDRETVRLILSSPYSREPTSEAQ